ncbi:MAG: replication factor C large subunit [Methermicoccaceae archaeon]
MTPSNSEVIEWVEKYRPDNISEVVGNKQSVKNLIEWASSWEEGAPKKRAVICYGKPGCGKTSTLHALARYMDWEVVELNASDQRTAAVIEDVVGHASTSGTLSGAKRRLVLLDEADNVHSSEDRGGALAIAKAIRNTNQPLALTANDLYGVIPSIRVLCEVIRFNALQVHQTTQVLARICRQEGIDTDIEVLRKIAEGAEGDLRSAINDLQALAIGRDTLREEDLIIAARDRKDTIFKLLPMAFKGKPLEEVIERYYRVDETPDNLLYWLSENAPAVHKDPASLSSTYEHISKADVFLGRVRHRQMYSMWKYATVHALGGVAAQGGITPQIPRLSSPSYWKALKRVKSMRGIRNTLSLKLGRAFHTSASYARFELISFVRYLCKDNQLAISLTKKLELTEEELEYLVQDAKRVAEIWGEAAPKKDTTTRLRKNQKSRGGKKKEERKSPPDPPSKLGKKSSQRAGAKGTGESEEEQEIKEKGEQASVFEF